MLHNDNKKSAGFYLKFPTVVLITSATACGLVVKDDVEQYDRSHEGIFSKEETGKTDKSSANLDTDPSVIVPFKCKTQLHDVAFASKVIQTMYGRSLNEDELNEAKKGKLKREKFVDEILASREADNGVTRFVTNLFRLNNIAIKPDVEDEDLLEDSKLVADFKKEPVELVLRNLEKPWPWFFTTKNIYCTKNTAKLYDFPEFESEAFVSCQLPPDRAGFLGLASVLRANTSSMIATNNNYHRVSFAMYLAQGFKLLDATNGPTGEGTGIPLAACVPSTDTRVDPAGLVYGTAIVPAVGPTCASCHARYNGPLSIAFRRFAPDGKTYSYEDLDNMNNNVFTALGTSRDFMKSLLNEAKSCWSPDGISPPRDFSGVPGLGRLIAESGTLGDALGVQIPQNLGNHNTDPNMSSTIRKYYEENSQTLPAALKGYLLSESFQCAVAEE